MSDIVEKLKGPRTEQGGLWPIPNLHDEAAAEILRLRAENEKLRAELEALKKYEREKWTGWAAALKETDNA